MRTFRRRCLKHERLVGLDQAPEILRIEVCKVNDDAHETSVVQLQSASRRDSPRPLRAGAFRVKGPPA
ncbi:hypothetical protein D1227_09460 [Henriciella mobilis]|uniref:Uncharacterized protein n=1 Tax=Henriciella mobilis TaxID=2305467 RepID=A0A399R9W4_9PROT|nr:hypothetical protein D1231_14320 [Henriciella mobilis]RIJ21933.1 hypothetical protein D1227_09460 [Henriciella mobilis]RIJ26747.1 hypothetical protein D1223_17540 [Henriciella mobilis]